MIDAVGSLRRHALAGACLFLLLVAPVSAQYPQPLPDPPTTFQFLPRFSGHIGGSYLGGDDPTRFMWDADWGADFDLVDYVAGRVVVLANYQAVLGDEFQPFDPNQGNYTLEASASLRFGGTELAGIFHHESRHLGDRPKRDSIAMNLLGARLLRRFEPAGWMIDLKAEAGGVVARAYVDYSWTGSVDITARHRLTDLLAGYGRVFGQFYEVGEEFSDRDTQRGGRIEAGIRVGGRGAALDVFAGWEQVVDADPFDRQTRSWPIAGFRLVN